jgi:hypothetical protein
VERGGVGDRQLGVAAAGRAEVGDDAPGEQVRVGAGAERVDDPGDLAPRDRRQLGSGSAPCGRPERIIVSTRCTPAAATAIRTWPGPGAGSSTVS